MGTQKNDSLHAAVPGCDGDSPCLREEQRFHQSIKGNIAILSGPQRRRYQPDQFHLQDNRRRVITLSKSMNLCILIWIKFRVSVGAYYIEFNEQMERVETKQQPMIRVVIRKRPLNKKEAARGEQDIVDVLNCNDVVVREQKVKVDLTKFVDEHQFRFDYALSDTANNQEVYEECVRPIVECAFQGAKVTCFAYGQTGSGKTYTMNGDPENGVLGMYYLGAEDIFAIRDQCYPNLDIYVSFYEIYCSKLFDLLNGRQQLQAREDAKQNVNIIGLTVKRVGHTGQFMAAIAQGSAVRITSQNSTNSDSSRSHAILQIELRAGKRVHGKLAFIDLAGCERGADTLEQNKQTKIDGAEINKSLLALKECIRALDQGKNHTPFRGSKLTMVLKDSFSGFCKTVMIGNIAPGSGSCENTLNTLRYADRVKGLKKGGNPEPLSKEDKLSRQLMLPRNRVKQVLVDNQEDEGSCIGGNRFANNNSHIYSMNPAAISNNGYAKKAKYILKDENDKPKSQSNQTGQGRKGMASIDHHAEPLKSANHGPRRGQVSRNKSVLAKDKINLYGKHDQPAVSDRDSFLKNNSALIVKKEIKDIKDISVHINHRIHHKEQNQWERAFNRFRKWSPSPQSFAEMSQLFEEMVKMIMKEEVQLADLHRTMLVTQERNQKQLMGLYHETQNDNKNNAEMMDWASRLSKLLEGKAKTALQLKQRCQAYQQHLKEHEFCEGRLINAGEIIGDGQSNFFSNQN